MQDGASGAGNGGVSTRPAAFSSYIESLRPEAGRRGVSRAAFDRAFDGVTPDQEVIRLTRRQAEFAPPIWEYLDGAVSSTRMRLGNEARSRHGQTLAAVERAYGVPQAIVLGIWGMETNFGSYRGSKDVFRSLATLAHQGHRGDFFQGELLAALEILERGDVSRDAMKGSWAGAMGSSAIHAHQLSALCRRRQRRRASRHLEFGTRCAGIGGELPARTRLAARPALGHGGAPAFKFRLRRGKKPPSGNGRSGVCVPPAAIPCPHVVRRACSSPPDRTARPFWSLRIMM